MLWKYVFTLIGSFIVYFICQEIAKQSEYITSITYQIQAFPFFMRGIGMPLLMFSIGYCLAGISRVYGVKIAFKYQKIVRNILIILMVIYLLSQFPIFLDYYLLNNQVSIQMLADYRMFIFMNFRFIYFGSRVILYIFFILYGFVVSIIKVNMKKVL